MSIYLKWQFVGLQDHIISILMLNPLPSMQYAANGCYYAINLSNQKQIVIQIQDTKILKRSTVLITESMLQQYNFTTSELVQTIKIQLIYEGSNKKYLLSHDRDKLIMNFTYPKSKIKSMSFSCEWKDMHQVLSKDQRVAKQAETLIKNMEEVFQKMFECFSKQTDAKLADALTTMQRNYQILSKRMDDNSEKKISEFSLRCQKIIRQYELLTNQTLKQQRETLIDSNLRYFDEFRLIKTDLETSLMDCDLNIRELCHQVSDIRAFVLELQEKTEEKVDKLAFDMQDLERTVRFSFKHINDQLASLQESQPPQDGKNIAKKLYALKIPQMTSANQRKLDSNQVQKELTTFIPILSEKDLNVSPKEGTIFLDE